MSGSGSSVFALTTSPEAAEACARASSPSSARRFSRRLSKLDSRRTPCDGYHFPQKKHFHPASLRLRYQTRVGSSVAEAFSGRYPSGQRGKTVNLLALPSQVRILFCPLLLHCEGLAAIGGGRIAHAFRATGSAVAFFQHGHAREDKPGRFAVRKLEGGAERTLTGVFESKRRFPVIGETLEAPGGVQRGNMHDGSFGYSVSRVTIISEAQSIIQLLPSNLELQENVLLVI